MPVRFIPVTDITEPLSISIGLAGGTSTGKTWSACLLARGIAESFDGPGAPFIFADTENKRALHYAEAFPEMMHYDMSAVDDDGQLVGFTPERWIEVIDAADEAGVKAMVIDSFSHSWEGVGGHLDDHAAELDRLVSQAEARSNGQYRVDPAKFSEKAWIEPKRRYRRLTDRIVRAKTNIIICNRAKAVRQAGFGNKATNARETKLRRNDVPWDIAGDANLIFEMLVQVVLDPSAKGCPVHQIKMPDQFQAIFDPARPISEETGRQLAEWSMRRGNGAGQKKILDAARDAARRGKDALNQHWKEASREDRSVIQMILDKELKHMAVRADEDAASSEGDDLFAGDDAGDDDAGPTPEQLERAEREAREEIQRLDAERNGRAA